MATIQNFGFMWERVNVTWGQPGPGGAASLEGVMVGNRKRRVEFAEQMGIYVLYDKWEQPVQIGQSKVIFKRLKQHRRDHLRNRWSLFSWFGFFKVGANNKLLVKDQTIELKRTLTLEDSLNELEAILIQVLEPRLNRRGPNWIKAEEYLQSPRIPRKMKWSRRRRTRQSLPRPCGRFFISGLKRRVRHRKGGDAARLRALAPSARPPV